MKTIIAYAFSLILLSLSSCSKSSSSNDDAKYPDNIAGTWKRSITSYTQISDTFTTAGADERWLKDMVILTSSEVSQLQSLIEAVPKQTRDAFARKLKKYKDIPPTPNSVRSDIYPAPPEYDEFYKFCVDNKSAALPLAMGYLFNDTDESLSELGAVAMGFCIQNKFEDLQQQVNGEVTNRKYTEDGLYTVRYSNVSLKRRLAKKILNQQ